MTIKVFDYVKSDTAISYDDGLRCMDDILKFIDEDDIELDFNGVDFVITAFLNPIIGDVIVKKGKDIMSKVHIVNANQDIQNKIEMLAKGVLLYREDLQ